VVQGLDMRFLGGKRRKIIAVVCKYRKTNGISVASRFGLCWSLRQSGSAPWLLRQTEKIVG
jgi:hypothetical protein